MQPPVEVEKEEEESEAEEEGSKMSNLESRLQQRRHELRQHRLHVLEGEGRERHLGWGRAGVRLGC